MNRLLVVAFAAIALVGCAKVIVVAVPPNHPMPANGVIYALPNTVIRVSVKIDSTEYQVAKYAAYAEIFAPGGKPICKDSACTEEKKTKFSLEQGTTFATYGEPDPDNVFLVKFTNGGAIDQQVSMTWDEAGLLTAATSQVTNRTTDVAMSGLKLLAGLGTKAAAGAAQTGPAAPPEPTCPGADYSTDLTLKAVDNFVIGILTDKTMVDALTGANLVTNYCEIDPDARRKLPQISNLLKAATNAYVVNISQLVAARTKFLSGNSVEGDASAILTQVSAELTNQLTKLYIGSKSTTTWDGTLDVRPTSPPAPVSILHLDPAQGFCVEGAEIPPDAKPIPDKFTRLVGAACTSAPAVTLGFAYYPDTNKQLFTKITDITEGDRSFRYRIPGQVSAAVTDSKGKTYGTGVMWVAQFGRVISLPADRRSKMLSYDLTFVEATGGLKTFKLGTTGGLDAATIDALTSVGGTVLDYRAAASNNSDELSTLTKEDQMLKLRDDICTIQKKYGIACTVEPQASAPPQ